MSHRKLVRIVVYVLLLTSAAAAFLLGDRLWAAARLGDVPIWAPFVAPASFTLFVAVFAIDRWLLVRRRSASLGRAALQVVFAIIFLTLLWPQQTAQFRATKAAQTEGDPAVRLLRHADPGVRAVACEVLGWRREVSQYATLQRMVVDDPSADVKATCGRALERLSAAQLEPSE